MNKKLFLFFTAVIVITAMTFVSCGGDDDGDANVNGGSPASVLKDKDGNSVRLTSISAVAGNARGDVWFEYDQNGRVVRFGDGEISYSVTNNTLSADGNSLSYKFGMNSKGLITSLVTDFDFTNMAVAEMGDEIRNMKGTLSTSYSYDSSNQLTGITYKGIAEGDNGGNEKGTSTYNATLTNTWKDGNLVKISYTFIEDDPNVYGNWEDHIYITYEQNTTINYSNLSTFIRQFPLTLGNEATSFNASSDHRDGLSILCLLGLFGVGPINLPSEVITEIVETWDEPDKDPSSYRYKYDYAFEFTQNSNGTIATEKVSSSKTARPITYEYRYGETRSAFSGHEPMNILPNVESIIKMFHHKKR